MNFEGRTALITGAGGGLGRAYALELARRGANVIVNDLGGARDGSGGSLSAAETVVQEIEAAGGTAMADGTSVTDNAAVEGMVAAGLKRFGAIDILINNAGILRDKSFAKMSGAEWNSVIDVHLNGAAHVTNAVWNPMREAGYGRVVMTTSTSGIMGNFGQANYGAAKAGMWGLMNTLAIEGASKGVHVNCISPTATTRMTDDIFPAEIQNALDPVNVVPGVVYLCSEEAPNSTILLAGAGTYAKAAMVESDGVFLAEGERTAEAIAANWDKIKDLNPVTEHDTGGGHVERILERHKELNS